MFNRDNLQELLEYQPGMGNRVVSVYLDADLAQRTSEKVKLQLRNLLKEADNKFNPDITEIERYFDYSFSWGTPGAAVFSCASTGFFRAFAIPVSFRNRLRIRQKPYVKPLVHLLEHYANYGVIAVDQIGAQFYIYHLGELRTTGGTMGEDVRKLKRGSGSSVMGMRGGQGGNTEKEQVLRNMRDAAAAAEEFFAPQDIRRLFIAGTTENVAQFREQLSRRMHSLYAGSFPLDMDAGEAEVRSRSLALLAEINADRERRLVEQMVEASAAGGPAVTGLGPTLRMVSDGRVETLIISEGLRMPGYVHANSGYLAATADEELFGDDGFYELEDVVEEAIERTLKQSGHVEFISDNEALQQAGNIGAILRY